MSFLPNDYEAPATWGNYTKLKKGTTRLRILSDSIVWRQDRGNNKPINSKERKQAIDNSKQPRHFRAFVVWNYEEKSIQVFQVLQKAIQNSIYALYKDQDRWDPKLYDLKITKEGDWMETKYTITTGQIKPIEDDIDEEYKKSKISITELYRNWDPFNPTNNVDDDLPF